MAVENHPRRRKFSWPRRWLYSLIPAVVVLGLLETLLGLAGVRPVTDRRDPYVGFAGRAALYEEQTDARGRPSGMMHTAYPKLVWFNPQSFPRQKPAGTKRIFCLGGSTTFGRPYSDPTSYVGWMRELLPLADPSCGWEVINAGGVSYASYRVAAVMEELLAYQPDWFVIYTAHNEFLERRTYAGMFQQPPWLLELQALAARTRTFALLDQWLIGKSEKLPADILPAEVDERLNHTIGPADYHRDPLWQRQVVEHYRVNLQRMIDLARTAGVGIMFISPASNAKDCGPFKSEFDAGLAGPLRQELASALEQAQAAYRVGDWPQVEQLARRVLNEDAGVAHAHYLLGQAELASGRPEAAYLALQQAIEQDVCPLRAIGPLSAQLREVTEQHGVPLVDFDGLLSEVCEAELGHRCLGREYFLDHVHPDIPTHRRLAVWIIDALQQAGGVGGVSLSDPRHATAILRVVAAVEGAIDLPRHGVALRNLAKVLHWSGKFDEAAPRASDALELLPGDPESRFVLADCLKNMGDLQGALTQYELLFEDEPFYARGLLPYGELLVELELYERAKAQLLLAVLRQPDNPYALFLLGTAHLRLDEPQFAIECLEKANLLYPGDPATLALLREATAAAAR